MYAHLIQPCRPIQMRSSALLMPTRAGSSRMRSLTVPIRPPSITTKSPRSKCWTTDRVALVGDACQAVSPLAGQGASLAVAGAVVTAAELERGPDVTHALARYHTRMAVPVAALMPKWTADEG
jgi:2-polyprenyl-6-methoxyphenol hydroxylase-like FAD-dependent oxidoreductase